MAAFLSTFLLSSGVQVNEFPTTVVGVYARLVGDATIYEFNVDGVRKTYRRSFCPFLIKDVKRGDSMTIRAHGSVIDSIELPSGLPTNGQRSKSRRHIPRFKIMLLAAASCLFFKLFTKPEIKP